MKFLNFRLEATFVLRMDELVMLKKIIESYELIGYVNENMHVDFYYESFDRTCEIYSSRGALKCRVCRTLLSLL